MKALVVVSVDVPDPEAVADVIQSMGIPRSLVHFDGEVRIVVGSVLDQLTAWLDEEEASNEG